MTTEQNTLDWMCKHSRGRKFQRDAWPMETSITVETDPVTGSRFFRQHVVGLDRSLSASISPDDVLATDWRLAQ